MRCFMFVYLFWRGYASIEEYSEHDLTSDLIANSCINKKDGEYWLLLSDSSSDYFPVRLECSNEYVILNINKDPNILGYFSSIEKWHHSAAGPSNSDPVNWLEWFLPDKKESNQNAEYLISPDCNVCDDTHTRQVHGTETSYWMSGNLAKLHWAVIGFNECDMDYDTYECYDCSSCMTIGAGCEPTGFPENTTNYKYAGICAVTVEPVDHIVYTQRKIAQSSSGVVNYKPSIGTNGAFCMCYKPSQLEYYSLTDSQSQIIEDFYENVFEKDNNIAHSVSVQGWQGWDDKSYDESYDKSQEEKNKENNEIFKSNRKDLRSERKIYLSQKDFESGTYRITKSGTYIITEDIVFDFNREDDYWPTTSQNTEYNYPGAGTYRDAYHLGFFAGITIETDYVIIDLNKKELKQSIEFYYQQRWFAIIELSNQQFLPGQGPAFFGSDPIEVHDIEIKNGVLGLSSHFGIHGNFPTNFVLDNVHIKEFATHGLQLNGWDNIIINNVEIGPSSCIEYLRGDYAHGRIVQQRLRAIEMNMINDGNLDSTFMEFIDPTRSNEEYGKIRKYGNNGLYYRSEKSVTKKENDENDSENENFVQKVTISEIADELDIQMMLALDYAVNRANGGLYEKNGFIRDEYYQNEEIYNEQRWEEVKYTFLHESGLPSASSLTGLFLNFEGASVFSYVMYTTRQSKNAVLNNIYIHDLHHEIQESMRFSVYGASGQMYPTPWNSDIPAEAAVGGPDIMQDIYDTLLDYQEANDDEKDIFESKLSKFAYIGSIMTDAYFAMAYFSDDWGILGFLQTEAPEGDRSLLNWVQGKSTFETNWMFGCNQDIMGHSGKGLLGFRMDGVKNVELNNIIISNLKESSKLGSNACGEYTMFSKEKSGGHFKQSTPMQWGFSGNNLQAMSIISSTNIKFGNIYIKNIYNKYSESFGMSFWTGLNDISVKPESIIIVSNVVAGAELENGKFEYFSKPNRSPEGCGMRLETHITEDASDFGTKTVPTYYGSNVDLYESWTLDEIENIKNEKENENNEMNVFVCDVFGHEYCLGGSENYNNWMEINVYTMFGKYDASASVCEEMVEMREGLKWIKNVIENENENENVRLNLEELGNLLNESENGNERESDSGIGSDKTLDVKKDVGKKEKGVEIETKENENTQFKTAFYQLCGILVCVVIVIIACCVRAWNWMHVASIKNAAKTAAKYGMNVRSKITNGKNEWKLMKYGCDNDEYRCTYADYLGDNNDTEQYQGLTEYGSI